MKVTKVYLVGAGPGAEDLLTLRARQLLDQADAIIYDALVGQNIISTLPRGCELIYVGKRAGRHAMRQEEINEVLINAAQEIGGTIVRLKGGDPFVFGRGGEEMIALRSAGIAYEVVPGITAGIAAPAYCGIPVTQRSVSRSISLITAFSEDLGVPTLDWEALVRTQGTLVFYMSMRVIPQIAQALRQHGMPEQTPAAIISRATLPSQEMHRGTLESYCNESISYDSYSPGLWIVGDVVQFADTYSWLSAQPLRGKRVLVTRAEAQASRLAELLRSHGAEVHLLPTLQIKELDHWYTSSELSGIPQTNTCIAFTSANGVHHYMRGIRRQGLDARALYRCRIAAIGPATADALRSYCLEPDIMPKSLYTARGLSEALLEAHAAESMQGILLPTSKLTSGELKERLENEGIQVQNLFVYDNEPINYTREEVESLLANDLDYITFCSSSAVHHFMELLDRLQLRSRLEDCTLCSIGPVTSDTLRSYHLEPHVVASKATLDSLVEAIERHNAN